MSQKINLTEAVTKGRHNVSFKEANENDILGYVLLEAMSGGKKLDDRWPDIFAKSPVVIDVCMTINGIEVNVVNILMRFVKGLAEDIDKAAKELVASRKNGMLERIENAVKVAEAELMGHDSEWGRKAYAQIDKAIRDKLGVCRFCETTSDKHDMSTCPMAVIEHHMYEMLHDDEEDW